MSRTHESPAANGAPEKIQGGGSGTSLPIHEPSAWLRQVAAARVRQIAALNLPLDTVTICAVGRSGREGSREDRTCDRCRRYVAPPQLFHPFVFDLGAVLLTGGLCPECRDREVSA